MAWPRGRLADRFDSSNGLDCRYRITVEGRTNRELANRSANFWHLTLNGLAELQWHMLAIIVMLGISYAMTQDRHVRVDLIYSTLSPRGQALTDLIGDLLFLLPFCVIIGWLSIGFVEFSYRTGEQSDYGGLVDRYLIKAIIPIGLALLGLIALGRIIVNFSRAIGWSSAPSEADRG